MTAPADYETIEGVRYEVMFAPNGAQARAGVYKAGKPITWLGAPSPAQQEAMKGALAP